MIILGFVPMRPNRHAVQQQAEEEGWQDGEAEEVEVGAVAAGVAGVQREHLRHERGDGAEGAEEAKLDSANHKGDSLRLPLRWERRGEERRGEERRGEERAMHDKDGKDSVQQSVKHERKLHEASGRHTRMRCHKC